MSTGEPPRSMEKKRKKKVATSFVQIISNFVIQEQKLVIPEKFVRIYAEYIPETVVLKVPNGAVWKVELEMVDATVSFGNGWHEFAEQHSLTVGNFLVFDYDRKSEFSVLIFDMSGTEIDYSCNRRLQLVPVNEEGTIPKLLNPLPVSLSNAGGDDDATAEGKKPAEGQENDGVVQASDSFKSAHPFFKITMTRAYVTSRYLPISLKFYRSYLLPETQSLQQLTIQASDGGKQWLVKSMKHRSHVRLSKGISAFLADNHIKVGDICFFELIKEKNVALKVHIFSQ